VKTQIVVNDHKPVKHFACVGTCVALTAFLMMAMAPACIAQDLPVNVMPKTPPPVAPAISVTSGAAGAAQGPGQAEPPAPPAVAVSVLHAATIPGALSSVTRSASGGNMLHVTLGHSLFIDTKTRLRRVYISDPAVVNSVTLNPNQILVTGMTPGISSLTLLDEAGLAQSYVVSTDIDIDGLRTAMAEAMRGDSVKVEGSGGRVTLSGTVASDAQADAAVKLAGYYSKDVANALVVAPGHPKQVRLQVRILEVDRNKELQLGINLFSPGGSTNYVVSSTSSGFPTTATVSQATATSGALLTTSNPLSFLLYSAKLNLGTTIQDLQTKQVLQILAEPTITTISGVKADFLSGGEFPFPSVQPGGTNSAPVISVSFRAFGVKVEFTPIVNEDGTIRLKVAPEVSALDYTNAVSLAGITVPALSTRRATTEVELRSEQSFAISGLLDQRTTDAMSKNPGAASIPILGNFFKSKNQNHSVTELVVVVTPTVVDPLAETETPNQPDLPIPQLSIPQFDKSLGKNRTTQPAAPPITPDHPPIVPPVFPPSIPAAAPAKAGAAENAAPVPAPAPQSAPAANPSEPASSSAPAAPVTTDSVLQAFADPGPRSQASNQQGAGATSMVEVMALSHESDADVMVAALKRRGYNVAVNRVSQDSLLHLDVGPFANKNDAEAMRQRLITDGYNATMK
jgi:pilus assembly protein CpaC